MGVNILVGAAVLTLGRKLFWLFVGCLGFVLGYTLLQELFVDNDNLIIFVLALIFGLMGALLAVFMQKLAIGIAGFVSGGILSLYIVNFFQYDLGPYILIPCLAGGFICMIFSMFLFDLALILLSSLVGASLIVQSIEMGPTLQLVTFTGLVLLGLIIQLKLNSEKE